MCPVPGTHEAQRHHSTDLVDQPGARERVYAISGTVSLPDDVLTATLQDPDNTTTPAGKEKHETSWPRPGDEGFWRQKDGELEWIPAEPQALLEKEDSAPHDPHTSPPASQGPGEASTSQTQEYDEWSASIGGEDSDTWLSFEEWREKHLAEEKVKADAEKIRHGRKGRGDKGKEAAKAADTADGRGHANGNGHGSAAEHSPENKDGDDVPSPQHDISSNGDEKHDNASSPSHEGSAMGGSTDPEAASTGNPEHTSSGHLKAHGDAIPAMGNASSELATLKHRWNFASLDCAAVVHRSNQMAKFASSILSEKKDRYMLSPCPTPDSEQQFVIVELCDEIIVDTVVLANFEFFSRMFKRFRIRVSKSLNSGEGDWVDVGTFRARNIRGLQVFKPINPPGDARFYRYIRLDFLEHYGSEYYCPISLLRVYGLTQMDDYLREEEELRKQREAESRYLSEAAEEDDEGGAEKEIEQGDLQNNQSPHKEPNSQPHTEQDTDQGAREPSVEASPSDSVTLPEDDHTWLDAFPDELDFYMPVPLSSIYSQYYEEPTSSSSETQKSAPVNGDAEESTAQLPTSGLTSSTGAPKATAQPHTSSQSSVPSTNHDSSDATSSHGHKENTTVPVSNETAKAHTSSNNSTTAQADASRVNTTSSSRSESHASSSSRPESHATHTQASQQQHGGSESIYRAITKRLNSLETNATLSLRYIDHQRQMLRETFARMERNQRDKIGQMLRELNTSNWRQIESLKRRQQVDLQQALFEFDTHRQQTDAERRALLAQVHILSNEIILEKRFGIAQLALLLGLFVFMVLTRGSRTPPLINEGFAKLSRTSSLPSVESRLESPLDKVPGSHSASLQKPDLTPRSEATRQKASDGKGVHMKHQRSKRGGTLLAHGRRSNSTRRGQLLIPAHRARGSDVQVLSEITSPNTHYRHESLSTDEDMDHRNLVAPRKSSKAHPQHLLGMGRANNVATPHSHGNPVSRSATLTQSSVLARKPIPDDSPALTRHTMDDAQSAAIHLQPPVVINASEESMSSGWGTERSEDGDESDVSSSWHGPLTQYPVASPTHISPPNRQQKHLFSPPISSGAHGRNASLNPINDEERDDTVRITEPWITGKGTTFDSSQDTHLLTKEHSGKNTPKMTNDLPALALVQAAESDAEEDFSAWSPVRNRKSIRRPASSGHTGENNPRTPSRLHTPTGPGPASNLSNVSVESTSRGMQDSLSS